MEWAEIAVAAAIPTAGFLIKDFFKNKATKLDLEQFKRQIGEKVQAMIDAAVKSDEERDRQLLQPIEADIERLEVARDQMHKENREDMKGVQDELKAIRRDVATLISRIGNGHNFP